MWYWKQTDWNEYTLSGSTTLKFRTYKEMYRYCLLNNIDARQC